jgi:hypothetical protein
MPPEKLSLGQAIDKIIEALQGLDEKSRQNAISAACAQLDLVAEKKTPAPPSGTPADAQLTKPQFQGVAKDIRTLKEEKNPESAMEMACVVAYYLLRVAPPAERKESVTIRDMNKYFVQGHYPLLKGIKDLLVNAKSAGYFDSVGHGAYRLNAVGHNLVAHTLPRTKKS